MAQGSTALKRLADRFSRMPGIGRKTAQRMAYYIISLPKEESAALAQAILDASEKVRRCSVCCTVSCLRVFCFVKCRRLRTGPFTLPLWSGVRLLF